MTEVSRLGGGAYGTVQKCRLSTAPARTGVSAPGPGTGGAPVQLVPVESANDGTGQRVAVKLVPVR